MKLLLGLFALLLSGCLLTGCADFFPSTSNCTAVTVSPSPATLTTGQVQQFTASCSGQDVTTLANWTSSSPTTLCMNGNTGLALAAGSATVSAIANNIQGTSSATVTGTSVTTVAVNQPSTGTTIPVGTSAQFTATAGSSTVTNALTWASTNTGIATINTSGLATGVAAGTANISGTLPNGCGITPTGSPVTVTVQ